MIKDVLKRVVMLAIFLALTVSIQAQYKFRYNNDYPATLAFGNDRHNGFRVSVSLVAMFTTGVADRNGIRLGGGIELSQTWNNWMVATGIDLYKAQEKFGLGTSYAGVVFDDGKYGGSYYVNQYFQGDKQVSGIVSLRISDFRVRFEDDILAYPFSGFKIYDRYRTAALELRYKGIMAGFNVYTTDMNGVTDLSAVNSKGVYKSGRQISSPIYVGYTSHDILIRAGLNSNLGGLLGQNGWHQYLFDTPDFNYGNYKSHFLQLGVDKPYTLY